MPQLQKIACSELKLGMRFTLPVFFDDGKNMFLAKRASIKNYHLNAIKQWNLEYVLTAGAVLEDNEAEDAKLFAGFAKRGTIEDIAEDLEPVDEVEELQEVEEL